MNNRDRINISESETIHYKKVGMQKSENLFIAVKHKHPVLKNVLQRIRLVSLIILFLFFCAIMFSSYKNYSTFSEQSASHKVLISSLTELADFRDMETGKHLERTREYSVILARQMRKYSQYNGTITEKFIRDIFDAAPLHDIGKVGIRDSILLKKGKLYKDEFDTMKKHVQIGTKILEDAIEKSRPVPTFLKMARNICHSHHEKYNGKGYYQSLKGEEIPIEARIFAICDAYEAIRSKRPYKEALSHEEAVHRIQKDSGEHFDPAIVKVFLKSEREFLKISLEIS